MATRTGGLRPIRQSGRSRQHTGEGSGHPAPKEAGWPSLYACSQEDWYPRFRVRAERAHVATETCWLAGCLS